MHLPHGNHNPMLLRRAMPRPMHIKTVSTPRLTPATPVDPAKVEQGNQLLQEVRDGAGYAAQRLEYLNARDREAGGEQSEEAKNLQNNMAALRSAISNADLNGVYDALDLLVIAKEDILSGEKSIYASEQLEKKAKKADKAREKRKRKKAKTKASAATAADGAEGAEEATDGGQSDVEAEEMAGETTVIATSAPSAPLPDAEATPEMPSLADSTSSLEEPAHPATPGSATASAMSDDAESSSTPASSSHGDTPTAAPVDAPEEVVEEPVKPLPSQLTALVEEETALPAPTPSTSSSGKASPARRDSFEAAERAADWADEVAAAAARARADSPAGNSDSGDWQEVVKAPRGKRGPSQLSHDDGHHRPAPPIAARPSPAPRTSWGKGNYSSANTEQHGRSVPAAGPSRPPEPPWTARSPVPYLFNEPGSRTYNDDHTKEKRVDLRVSLGPVPGLAQATEGSAKRLVRNRNGIREVNVTLKLKPQRQPPKPSKISDEPIPVKLSPTAPTVNVEPRKPVEDKPAPKPVEEKPMPKQTFQTIDTQAAAAASASASASATPAPTPGPSTPIVVMPNGVVEALPVPKEQVPIFQHLPSAGFSGPPPPQPTPVDFDSPIPPEHVGMPILPGFDAQAPPASFPMPGQPFIGPDGFPYVIDPLSGRPIPFTPEAIAAAFAHAGFAPPPGVLPDPGPSPAPVDVDSRSSPAPPASSSSTPAPVGLQPAPVLPPISGPMYAPAFFVPARSSKIEIKAPTAAHIAQRTHQQPRYAGGSRFRPGPQQHEMPPMSIEEQMQQHQYAAQFSPTYFAPPPPAQFPTSPPPTTIEQDPAILSISSSSPVV